MKTASLAMIIIEGWSRIICIKIKSRAIECKKEDGENLLVSSLEIWSISQHLTNFLNKTPAPCSLFQDFKNVGFMAGFYVWNICAR